MNCSLLVPDLVAHMILLHQLFPDLLLATGLLHQLFPDLLLATGLLHELFPNFTPWTEIETTARNKSSYTSPWVLGVSM